MADSTVTAGTYAHTLSPTYTGFTATFDFSNTTLQYGAVIGLFGANNYYGWVLQYNAPNLVLIDPALNYVMETFSGVPSTVTVSYNGVTVTCNGESFNYDGTNNFSEQNINSTNPLTSLQAGSNFLSESGTITVSLTAQGYIPAPTTSSITTPGGGETVVSSNPYTTATTHWTITRSEATTAATTKPSISRNQQ